VIIDIFHFTFIHRIKALTREREKCKESRKKIDDEALFNAIQGRRLRAMQMIEIRVKKQIRYFLRLLKLF
jgi:hypothetical protein